MAGFNSNITEILANANLTAAMGGDPARDTEAETYSCSLKCHDPNGEVYYVTFGRVPGSVSPPTRMTPSQRLSRHRPTPSRRSREGVVLLVPLAVVTLMENEVLIVGIFVSAGVLS